MGKKLAIGLVLFAMGIAFQNCGSASWQNDDLLARSNGGNGEGYDGKVKRTYVDPDISKTCPATASSESRSVIEETETGYWLTVENCERIEPRLLSAAEIAALPHNPQFAVYKGKLFQAEDAGIGSNSNTPEPGQTIPADATIVKLCRGQILESGGSWRAYDSLIYKSGSVISAQVSRGSYSSSGQVLQSLWQQFKVQQTALGSGGTRYQASLASPESFRLDVSAQNQGQTDLQLKFGTAQVYGDSVTQNCYQF